MKLAIILITIGVACVLTGVILLRKSINKPKEEFYKDDLILESNRIMVLGMSEVTTNNTNECFAMGKDVVSEGCFTAVLPAITFGNSDLDDSQKAFIEQEKAKGNNGSFIKVNGRHVWIDSKNK